MKSHSLTVSTSTLSCRIPHTFARAFIVQTNLRCIRSKLSQGWTNPVAFRHSLNSPPSSACPRTVNSLFIKPDIDVTDELHIGPQQPAVYQMPVSSSDLTTMTFSQSQSMNGIGASGRTMLNLNTVALTTQSGEFVMPFYTSPQPHSLPPSPPNSQPGSPENQAELLTSVHPPPPYQARIGMKNGQMTPHSILMAHGQGILTGPRYNRRTTLSWRREGFIIVTSQVSVPFQ